MHWLRVHCVTAVSTVALTIIFVVPPASTLNSIRMGAGCWTINCRESLTVLPLSVLARLVASLQGGVRLQTSFLVKLLSFLRVTGTYR